MRVLVAWCPDWSVTAGMFELAETGEAQHPASQPAAVLANNIVEVCNGAARAEGVRRGQRRRDAQSRCPELVLLPANPERDVRYFEPVLATVEDLRPGVAPIRPGLLAVSAPGRYFGGEPHAAALLSQHLVDAGVWDCRFGVADDLFTAEQAARQAPVQDCVVVSPGASAAFIQALPVRVLADTVDGGAEGRELADLLRRLGLPTLGDFARLSRAEVSNRFGAFGLSVWQRAQGGAPTRLGSREPPPELACEIGFEPPLESAEAVCFSVRTTAERFVAGLAERQLVAVAVRIEAEADGVVMSARTWLHPRCFTSRDLIDRVHWQLQAGMASSGLRSRRDAGAVSAPVERVRFLPETVEPASAHAEGLWGGGADEQVTRGVARVQAMIGFDAVRTPVLQGGRSVADRQSTVAWGERPVGLRPLDRPWPGRIPGPAPSRVFAVPPAAEVVDEAGRSVTVTERGAVTGEPWRYRIDAAADVAARRWTPVASWAGPWPVDDAWWVSEGGAGRSARFQVVGVDGRAWLLVWRATGWEAEAGYD
ncbi:DNA polymerase Y family protein [Nocardioides humilatus]|uniref:DNA polymerase Y family protein n=1 Tax=Nocardioides humilatus TaxID=2607660 RepID=A0A5B1L739_9ACTN|nr:DNA polymerase Y family protein [Nocardioides humilatus]KAA1415988.1 DNA polymerase Y family protein [Nocardioides humilatus]